MKAKIRVTKEYDIETSDCGEFCGDACEHLCHCACHLQSADEDLCFNDDAVFFKRTEFCKRNEVETNDCDIDDSEERYCEHCMSTPCHCSDFDIDRDMGARG